MDYYDIIAGSFRDTMESIAMSVDGLAQGLERGSRLMSAALLADHKIMACGNGADGALAQLFVANLLGRYEQERPALPALVLAGDSPVVTAVAHANGLNDIFSRQVRALGQPGDVLLCINSASGTGNLIRAVQAARERNVAVVALSNWQDSELAKLLDEGDVELCVDATRPGRIVELQTIVLNIFCELIDYSLFGTYHPE